MHIFKQKGNIDLKITHLKEYFSHHVNEHILEYVKLYDITLEPYIIDNKVYIGIRHFISFSCSYNKKNATHRMTLLEAINQFKKDVQYFKDTMGYDEDTAYKEYLNRVKLMGVNSLFINKSDTYQII